MRSSDFIFYIQTIAINKQRYLYSLFMIDSNKLFATIVALDKSGIFCMFS